VCNPRDPGFRKLRDKHASTRARKRSTKRVRARVKDFASFVRVVEVRAVGGYGLGRVELRATGRRAVGKCVQAQLVGRFEVDTFEDIDLSV
jgi:hypothetical protein